MLIRRIAPGEERLIAELWRRSWASANPDVASLEPIEHWLARVQAEFFAPFEVIVAEVSGCVAAFIVFDAARAYVAQLFTDMPFQGRGLGRALLAESSRRMPRVWTLHVATTNRRAQLFYERYGLVRGEVNINPVSGRERVAYCWQGSEPIDMKSKDAQT